MYCVAPYTVPLGPTHVADFPHVTEVSRDADVPHVADVSNVADVPHFDDVPHVADIPHHDDALHALWLCVHFFYYPPYHILSSLLITEKFSKPGHPLSLWGDNIHGTRQSFIKSSCNFLS